MNVQPRIKVLETDAYREFERRYSAPLFTAEYPEEQHYKEYKELEVLLKRNLSKSWREDWCGNADYAVMDGYYHQKFHAIGIYTPNIYCSDLILAIQAALKQHGLGWAVHVACECLELSWGGFLVTANEVVMPNSPDGVKPAEFVVTRQQRESQHRDGA